MTALGHTFTHQQVLLEETVPIVYLQLLYHQAHQHISWHLKVHTETDHQDAYQYNVIYISIIFDHVISSTAFCEHKHTSFKKLWISN